MFLITLATICALAQVTLAGNLFEELDEAGATIFADYFSQANISDILETADGQFTLFAPVNEAFDELDSSMKESLDNNEDFLKNILLYHIVPEILSSKSLPEQSKVATLDGSPLHINLYLRSQFYKGFITANGVRVIKSDWEASNGVIHFIDKVIHPIAKDNLYQVLSDDGRFKTLLAAFQAAGLTDTLEDTTAGPFTLFAPTDEAFEKIPSDTLEDLLSKKSEVETLLKMHLLQGTLFSKAFSWAEHKTLADEKSEIAIQVFKGPIVKIATASANGLIVDTDLVANNGVVHAIDTVL